MVGEGRVKINGGGWVAMVDRGGDEYLVTVVADSRRASE